MKISLALRRAIFPALFASVCLTPALAQTVDVQDAWARATVPGQSASGVFMKLTASADTRLVAIASPAAAVAQLHTMTLEGGVMRMRALEAGLVLPAGKAVELKPGAYHVMLMDLKAPLLKDTVIPLTLTFRDAAGKETRSELKVPVSMAAPLAHAP